MKLNLIRQSIVLFGILLTQNLSAATINPSRVQGPVPLGVYFSQYGPISDHYRWDFGDGTTAEGFQAAHVYEQPGRYTARVTQITQSGSQSTAEVEINVSAFSGRTYYLDAQNGNDNASGLTPQAAWRSARKVNETIASFAPSQRRYLKFLLKRGTQFVLDEGRWIHLADVPGPIRIAAYANSDGSDNPSLPKPIIRENLSRTYGSESQNMITHLYNVKDVSYQDIALRGNYVFLPETYDNTPYPTIGFDSLDECVNTVFLRTDMTNFRGGLWIERVSSGARFFFIENSYLSHMQLTNIFGSATGYSLQNSRIQYSSISHLHYVAPRLGVILNNDFVWSGVFPLQGENVVWYQCPLRTASGHMGTEAPQAGRILISKNRISNATGYDICIGQNYSEKFNTFDVVIEKNFIDGYVTPGRNSMSGAGPIELASVTNAIVRNNVMWNPRGPITVTSREHEGSPGRDPSRDISILNNVILRTGTIVDRLIKIEAPTPGTQNIKIKNNIFYGNYSSAAIELEDQWQSIPGLEIDYNLYRPLNTSFQARLENGDENWQSVDYATWRNVYRFDLHSKMGVSPGWVTADRNHPDFLKLTPGSAALNACDESDHAVDDLNGEDRPQAGRCDMGVTEQ